MFEAASESDQAMYAVGFIKMNGLGVEKDLDEADRHFKGIIVKDGESKYPVYAALGIIWMMSHTEGYLWDFIDSLRTPDVKIGGI